MKYKPADNQFYAFAGERFPPSKGLRYPVASCLPADDVSARSLVSSVILDYDTIAGGDKFGNLFVARLPQDISSQVLNRRHSSSKHSSV